MRPARRGVGLDQRAGCRHRGLPNGDRGLPTLGVVLIGAALGNRVRRRTPQIIVGPQVTRPQSADDVHLAAARMAMDQRPAISALADREAGHAIVMRRAAGYPAASGGLPPAESLGDHLSGYHRPAVRRVPCRWGRTCWSGGLPTRRLLCRKVDRRRGRRSSDIAARDPASATVRACAARSASASPGPSDRDAWSLSLLCEAWRELPCRESREITWTFSID